MLDVIFIVLYLRAEGLLKPICMLSNLESVAALVVTKVLLLEQVFECDHFVKYLPFNHLWGVDFLSFQSI